MDNQSEQGWQRVGLTINAPEKLSHGREKQPRKEKHEASQGEHAKVAAGPTAEHKEPHRSQ